MKNKTTCRISRIGFKGKDGNTYLLSGYDKEKDVYLFKVHETNAFIELNSAVFKKYEKSGKLERFNV
jgi:hypothetical protein